MITAEVDLEDVVSGAASAVSMTNSNHELMNKILKDLVFKSQKVENIADG